MDYPHDPHHRRHHRREDEEEYPPPDRHQPPPPFYGPDEPPPPFHRRDEPPPPFHGRDEPPPPFHGRDEPPPPFHRRDEPPPPFHRRDEPPPPFHGRDEPPPPFHGRDEPPPPFYGGNQPPPPFGHQAELYHTSHHGPDREDYPAPPPPDFSGYSGPPPPAEDHPRHHFHMPHFGHHESPYGGPEVGHRPTVKMYCKAETNYSLAIRDGHVILARADPSDPFQHWIKEEKFSTRVKDEEGFPSFALVNKATGEAIKHAFGPSHPVQLIPYNPDVLDESILWTESKDTGDNYRAIRMVNNIRLNVDAWNADKDHGGVRDGTTISLWEWTKGDNQRWKIVPY